METSSQKRIVIVPTYNEAGNISRMIDVVLQLEPQIDLLVVDDASPDGTARIVEKNMDKYPGRLNLLEREGKLGLGTAYVAGFRYCLDKEYDIICEMDADFSHDPKELTKLVAEVERGTCDVAVGSRYHNGISIVNWPLSRLILSYTANLYARVITGLPIKDTTAGFKAFNSEVLKSIDLNRIKSNGYAFQIEMHYRAWVAGFRLKEISIIFWERMEGVSKMSKNIIFEAVWMVWSLKLRNLIGRL